MIRPHSNIEKLNAAAEISFLDNYNLKVFNLEKKLGKYSDNSVRYERKNKIDLNKDKLDQRIQ